VVIADIWSHCHDPGCQTACPFGAYFLYYFDKGKGVARASTLDQSAGKGDRQPKRDLRGTQKHRRAEGRKEVFFVHMICKRAEGKGQ